LVNVIKEAKGMTLNKRIFKSNKTKTTWNIMNELLGKQHYTQETHKLTIEGKHLTSQQDIVNAFSKYISIIIDKTNNDSDRRHGNPYTSFFLTLLVPLCSIIIVKYIHSSNTSTTFYKVSTGYMFRPSWAIIGPYI
jgi:hypothetical protein